MDKKTIFTSELHRSKSMLAAGDRPEYWLGYERGLRRAFYGDQFGTQEEHETWLAAADADPDDRPRHERGQGYRDGLAKLGE